MATLHPHALQARALHEQAPDDTTRDDARVRRLCVIAIAVAVLLAAYAGGVAWVTRLAEAGVDRSLQPLPALVRDHPTP